MNRAVRSLFSGSALTISAIAAHLFAGGGIIHGFTFILTSFVLICFSALATSNELEGPRLAFIILTSQIIGHFLLGTNTVSSISMALSHSLLAVFAYLVISSFESLAYWITSKFSITSLKSSNVLPEKFSRVKILLSKNFSIQDLFCCFQYWTTSPPLVANVY
jgi:uncharacterized membrane protein AbrB (regulator of aidB expression)